MMEYIGAAELTRMVVSAAAAIDNNKQILNEMNVFPVPDGDTGINMSLTFKAAVEALSQRSSDNAGKTAELVAAALLRGARGNSGVILSLLFRGLSKSVTNLEKIDAEQFANALKAGVDAAYRAVMKPAEGTILSVSRRAADAAVRLAGENPDIILLLEGAIAEAYLGLEDTVNQNPVLKKAGVLDAGAKGWVLVLEAWLSALKGEPVEYSDAAAQPEAGLLPGDLGADEEIRFIYCTEYIVNISRSGKKLDVARLRALHESIGDSVVVVDDEDIIKVHLHTNNPDKALGEALKYGELSSIKIENMREQHTKQVIEQKNRAEKTPEKKYGFVAVGAGEGIVGVYKDLGVDVIVEGGQTMNPSTQDILAAVEEIPAEVIFVLPNNKNIVLAAQQTVEMTEKKIIVIPTASIPQGISAMLAFNPEASDEENNENMTDASKNVSTGSITYAARDSEFDGHSIKQGQYLALCENKLAANGTELSEVARVLINDMGVSEKNFVTVFYGEGVSEEDAAAIEALCRESSPDAEIMLLYGGQPVYYYIISAE